MEVIGSIFNTKWFMFVSMADMQVDVFYWITGFTMAYHLLSRLKANNGTWWTHPARVCFERVLRLQPLNLFMLFFLWKFISVFGGSGPRFY